MQIDRERLALAILNSDRVAGGWPRIETRTHVLNSEGYLRNVDDVLAEIEAQGFVVVPREPTLECCKLVAMLFCEPDATA